MTETATHERMTMIEREIRELREHAPRFTGGVSKIMAAKIARLERQRAWMKGRRRMPKGS